jgi:hypothetical protein
MDDKLFDQLIESIKEMGAYLRGEIQLASRRIHVVGEPVQRESAVQAGETAERPRSRGNAP